jgi:glycosyltransferase, group 2 family
MPLLSIIIACYNHEHYIQDCIYSIINQEYQNIELIIIDDGSKDDSAQKIEEMRQLCEKRFVRFKFYHRPNKGLCATLNEALSWCQGKYVSMFASDDVMLPQKSSIQVAYLENNPDITSVSANLEFINHDNQITGHTNQIKKEYHFDETLIHNHLFAPSQMHHLSAIKNIGGFNESIMIEDWYLWLKLLDSNYRVVFLDDILVQYRKHDDNMSGNFTKMFQAEHQILSLYKNKPTYQKALYNLKRKEIKLYRDNGKKPYYYLSKISLMIKYHLLGKA